jgi:hypothetical protein
MTCTKQAIVRCSIRLYILFSTTKIFRTNFKSESVAFFLLYKISNEILPLLAIDSVFFCVIQSAVSVLNFSDVTHKFSTSI